MCLRREFSRRSLKCAWSDVSRYFLCPGAEEGVLDLVEPCAYVNLSKSKSWNRASQKFLPSITKIARRENSLTIQDENYTLLKIIHIFEEEKWFLLKSFWIQWKIKQFVMYQLVSSTKLCLCKNNYSPEVRREIPPQYKKHVWREKTFSNSKREFILQ